MKKFLLVSAFLLLPSLALGAGFAKQSLFLSKSPVTEGDTVHIYAVVSNPGTSKFSGTVVLADGDKKIGSVAVAMEAGGTQTASVSWRPSAGSHSIVAQLQASDGTLAEEQSATFVIAEKPKPILLPASTTSTQPAAVESSQQIQNQIGSFSPAAENATAPVFGALDSLRAGAAGFIDSQIVNTKNNLAKNSKPGVVAGESTEAPKAPDTASSFWFVLYTIYLYVLTIARFLLGNAGVFYPVLAIAFLYFLWKMFRRFRRPAY